MKRITKKITNSFSSLVRSSLRIAKISIKLIAEFFVWGVRQLILEIAFFGVVLGLTVIFSSWGVSNSLALGLSIVLVISICILSIRFFYPHKSRLAKRKTLKTNQVRVRQEEKLANWIAQTLAQKAPKEWEEYQDWLHDILLDRFQMLDRGFPVWKVRIITYWRLTGFCFIVSLIKLRRLVIHLRA